MTNQEIVAKAVERATAGGWTPYKVQRPVVGWRVDYSDSYDEGEGVIIWAMHARSNADSLFVGLEALIFNHDFAKALWRGKKMHHELMWEQPLWEHHLQRMVIADDPIQYLKSAIDGLPQAT